MDVTVVI